MSVWKEILPILLLLLLLTACGTEQSKSAEPQSKSAEPQSSAETTGPALQSSYSEGDVGDDTPLEWPTQLMGDLLPVPSGVITSIDTGSSFFGNAAPDYITVVSFKNMSRTDCDMYRNKLNKLGFIDDVTEQDTDEKILYSGSIRSEGCGVTFEYDFDEEKGFVSYNPMLDNDFIGEWPVDEMGGLPDPGCELISFTTVGAVGTTAYTVEFANMNEQAAKDYVLSLKALGYTPEVDASNDETIQFKGFDANGNGVVFQYSVIYENGIISYGTEDSLIGC